MAEKKEEKKPAGPYAALQRILEKKPAKAEAEEEEKAEKKAKA